MIFFKKTFKLLKHFIKYIKLFIIYFPFLNFIKTKQKEIIIVFDGNFGHGGLVDRLKGIVSFYAISKEINADFKIYFKHPFQLDTFLEPNQYNWLATDSDLNWNPFQTKFLFLMDNFSFNWKKTMNQWMKRNSKPWSKRFWEQVRNRLNVHNKFSKTMCCMKSSREIPDCFRNRY